MANDRAGHAYCKIDDRQCKTPSFPKCSATIPEEGKIDVRDDEKGVCSADVLKMKLIDKKW